MPDSNSPDVQAAMERGHLLACSAEALAVQARELLFQIFAEAPDVERQALLQTSGIPLLVLATAAGIVALADGDVEQMNRLVEQAQTNLIHDVDLCHLRQLLIKTKNAAAVVEGSEAVH